jgi:hypothetical protein
MSAASARWRQPSLRALPETYAPEIAFNAPLRTASKSLTIHDLPVDHRRFLHRGLTHEPFKLLQFFVGQALQVHRLGALIDKLLLLFNRPQQVATGSLVATARTKLETAHTSPL